MIVTRVATNWWEIRHVIHYDFSRQEWTCTCEGQTFKIGGRSQSDCRHIKEVKKQYGVEMDEIQSRIKDKQESGQEGGQVRSDGDGRVRPETVE